VTRFEVVVLGFVDPEGFEAADSFESPAGLVSPDDFDSLDDAGSSECSSDFASVWGLPGLAMGARIDATH